MTTLTTLINTARTADIPRSQRHAAFGELLRQYQAMAYATAYAILNDEPLAEEAVQEAFITAYQKLDQLREADAFPAWLKQIVRTMALRLVRGKRLPTASIDAAAEIPTPEAGPERKAEHHDLRECVLAAIRALPEHERSVVELFYMEGYSQREVAEVLTLPLTTVKKRLQYARRRLRQTMVEVYGPILSIASPQPLEMADMLLEIGFVLLETMPFPVLVLPPALFEDDPLAQAKTGGFLRQKELELA